MGVSYILVLGLLIAGGSELLRADEPAKSIIPINRPSRTERVDFDREVLPILRANCLPCHNKTTTKADLVLETPEAMAKGGESGAAITPGKALTSLLLQVSTHEVKPRMPPKENKVNAINLTPEQLGLIALWIDQGAPASPKREEAIVWQPLPEGLNPIYSVAITENGRYAACGRGNRVDVYRVSDGAFLTELADPELSRSNHFRLAHRDEVHSVALSPDGEWLASGGFREAKIWHRQFPSQPLGEHLPQSSKTNGVVLATDRKLAVEVTGGKVIFSDAEVKHFAMALTRDIDSEAAAAAAKRKVALRQSERDYNQGILEGLRKELDSQRERIKKAQDAYAAAAKEAAGRDIKIAAAKSKQDEAEIAVLKSNWETIRPKPTADQKKAAASKLEEAKKELAKTIEESKPQRQKLESARIELELASQKADRVQSDLLGAEWRRSQAGAELALAEAAARQAVKVAEGGCPKAIAAGFAPGDKLVVSSHIDGKLRVWRASDGAPIDTIPILAQVVDIMPGEPGYLILRTSSGHPLSTSVQPEWVLEHRLGSEKSDSPFADQVTALAFREDGKRLAAGSGEPTRTGDISLWDPATGQRLYTLSALHSDTVLSLAFSPDGWSLASGGADRFTRIVDTTVAKPVRALEGHTGHVLGVAWSPDGRRLATAGADLVVKYWDPATGEKSKQATGFGKEVTAVGFLANRDKVVAASGENELRVLNENGEKTEAFHGANDFTYSLGTTPDGKWIVAGGQDGVLRIWQTGKTGPLYQLTSQFITDSRPVPETPAPAR